MTLAEYSAISRPCAPRVRGFALRPLALGHALTLARMGSPFLREGAPRSTRPEATAGREDRGAPLPGLGDLLLALEVLSRDPLAPMPSRARLAWLWFWHRKLPEAALLDACIVVAQHLRASLAIPRHWSKPAPESGIHWLQAVKLCLLARLNKSEAEALTMPLTLAIHDCFAVWASEGALRLVTSTHDEMIARSRALQETGDRRQETGSRPAPFPIPHSPSPIT